MNRRKNTSRSMVMMTAIVMAAALISISGLTMIHTLPVEATRPIHNDNDNGIRNGNVNSATRESLAQNPGTNPTSGDGNYDSDDNNNFALQQVFQQQETTSSNAACGQVVSGQVNLTANLNCSGDGIIVGGPNT
ncbi:MAG: hypothetical protein ACRD47_07685, partial [Nitrososphaeraceae archaeon]